jgi:hypothetical protein
MRLLQAVLEARQRATAAAAAAKAAEKALAALETAIPKARMEADAQRALAEDLRARLSELRAATEVGTNGTRSTSQARPPSWLLRCTTTPLHGWSGPQRVFSSRTGATVPLLVISGRLGLQTT